MVFFATIALIIIGAGIPIVAMYACGQFVGQKSPRPILKTTVMFVVGLGLLMAVGDSALAMRSDGMTATGWLMLAWMAGSALAGQVALLEKLSSPSDTADRRRDSN